MERLEQVVTRKVVKALTADDAFLEGLSDKLRSSNMGAMVREFAREEIAAFLNSAAAVPADIAKALRIASRFGPIDREAAQALVDSLAPGAEPAKHKTLADLAADPAWMNR